MPDRKQSPIPPKSTQPPDFPERGSPKQPSDLPLPRHRPGEPIMYDPPVSGIETFPISDPERTHYQ